MIKLHSNNYDKIIYDIHRKKHFLIKTTLWSSPSVGFSYNSSFDSDAFNSVVKGTLRDEKPEDIIALLCDWVSVSEGIFFTKDKIFVKSPKNSERSFCVNYNDIDQLRYGNSILKIIDYDGKIHTIDHPMFSKRNIYEFLSTVVNDIKQTSDKTDADKFIGKNESDINYEASSGLKGTETAGVVFSNISNTSTNYTADKFNTNKGHGFAAEQMNHIYDKLTLKNAKLVADETDPKTNKPIKDGADRIVNGVNIQTKYCASGSKCIQQCFKDGKFRYYNPDGTPMKIEVPSDKFQDAVTAMENRIKNGEINGVSDISEAKNIVKKGKFTYNQAKNVAKAGTVESITFDAVNGAVVSANAFGITAVLTFATSVWNGDDFDVALKASAYSGLKIAGTSFLTAIIAGQLAKAGLNSAMVNGSEAIVKQMGPKAASAIANAFRSGVNIYGNAAIKSAAKLLRTNAITEAASILVLSASDVVNIFSGKISGAQLFKNFVGTTASVAAGGGGFIAGSAIGSVIPVVGTLIGGLVGAALAGTAASKASNAVLGSFIEDDADCMVKIIQDEFSVAAQDYLLNEKEVNIVVDRLSDVLDAKVLKEMYASGDRQEFARNLFIDFIEDEVQHREHINLPSDEEMLKVLGEIIEENN